MSEKYGEDYYIRGVEKKISNYQDYRWMEDQTMAMATRLIEVMRISKNDSILDWGAARGYMVKALRRLGVNAWGYDISEWAVSNCDPEVKEFVHNSIQHISYDHVCLKDLMEHLGAIDLRLVTDRLFSIAQKSILVIVPLTEKTGGPFMRNEDDMDVTHVVRWPLDEWLNFFQKRIPGESWIATGSWHIPGIKPTSLTHLKSCGFIHLNRYEKNT